MDPRKLVILLIASLGFGRAIAQEVPYGVVDSVSYQAYLSGDWNRMIEFGRSAIHSGTDFPLLRQRIAYALFSQGKYGSALREYHKVLESDSRNQTVLYYASLCQNYLNRPTEESWYIARLDDSVRTYYKTVSTGIVAAGVEMSVKAPAITSRGTGTYFRVSLQNRFGSRVLLDQSLALYSQPYYNVSNQQFDYYARASYPVTRALIALGAYHFVTSSYLQTGYTNHIGLAGLRFSGPIFELQANASTATLQNERVNQYDARVSLYPFGSLGFYLGGKASFIEQTSALHQVSSFFAGKQLTRNTWIEGFGSFGGLENFLDADALYVYNSPDNSDYKTGLTANIGLKSNTRLALTYTLENKYTFNQHINYTQHSLSGSILWKF